MKLIAFVDQDGHTVKLTKEEIALCLKDMGNLPGVYYVITEEHYEKVYIDNSFCAVQIRAITFPKYSRFRLWQKKRMGSRLIPRKIPMIINGKQEFLDAEVKPVWLKLKKNQVVKVYVH